MVYKGVCLFVVVIVLLTNHSSSQSYPFQNYKLPWEVRVDDLVKRLTLYELSEQMSKGGAGPAGGPSPGIDRLGISPYQWNTECLRGDAMAGNATSFPQALGLAASFSREIISSVAEAGAVEMRAKHNDYVSHGNYGDHTGLSCFAPVINIFRHPLWGRNQETYGEDPFLTGEISVGFVKGLQGNHPRYARATSTCKHFDAYGGPENIPTNRKEFDARVSDRDLYLTFLPAFKTCIQKGGTYAICCSYNRINGIPACSHKRFLTDILRTQWNFTGYVVSDWNALEYAITWHKYFNNTLDAAVVSINAGMNLELADIGGADRVYSRIVDAVNAGRVKESFLRELVKPLFYTRMRLGEFDPYNMNPYRKINMSVIQCPEHQKLAVKAAHKSIVLLKRPDQNRVPIDPENVKRIAVIGPMANNTGQLFGDYSPDADVHFVKTPLMGLSELGLPVNYAAVCLDGNACNNYSADDMKTALLGADKVIVCLGTGNQFETEGKDRTTMELPGKQLQLLKDLVYTYTNITIVLVLFNAGPVNMTWADGIPIITHIYEVFFPAQGIGEALKLVLTNKDGANPAGRLPFTWPSTEDQIPKMTDYSMKGRSYRYFSGTPLYPFGYGLSYSEFEYSQLKYNPTIKAGESLNVSVMIYNKGPYDGDEVVQLYIAWLDTKEEMPKIQLAGFDRVSIPVKKDGTGDTDRQFYTFIILVTTGCKSMADFPFRNTSLPWETRVNDLVNRLSMEEIMVQLSRGGSGPKASPAPAIKRLGIGPYSWDTECLRGDVAAGNATSFPQALGLAASFSTDVICNVAQATAVEVRAKFNDYVRHGKYGDHKGISCFSPVINIMRHPLWGRNQETYGEDPYLSGILAKNFVQCLQGSNPRYILASAGCKHFDVHGGPENIPVSRFSFDAKVSERDWRLTFQPAFKKCVQAGTASLMCSYNRINGVPACGNKRLLTDILRKEWGFKGYVISDQEAVENIMTYHHYTNNSIDTVALCINAGMNLELSTNEIKPVFFSMLDAIKAGKLSNQSIIDAIKPLFYTRMRLGEFDPPGDNPYNFLDLSFIQSPRHRNISLEAAMKSFVLLKNNGILPLSGKFNHIAVIGPMADNKEQLFGSYAPDLMPSFTTSPLQGLSKLSKFVNFTSGCQDNRCTNYSSTKIKEAVEGAEVIFVCLGTGQELESEDNDRSNMELPGQQLQLLQDAVKFAGKSPVILLLFNAGPLNISWADRCNQVVAILECFLPAQETGEALWRVLTGNSSVANPAARLPFTWPLSKDQIPSMTDYSMTGRTYRYFDGDPLYSFGYGLSYTTFHYNNAWLAPTIQAGDDLEVRVEISNTGKRDGDEVIQIYLKWLDTKEKMPNIQLVAFKRVTLKAGAVGNWSITIEPESMKVWSEDSGFIIEEVRCTISDSFFTHTSLRRQHDQLSEKSPVEIKF
ncbi:hypothetical protein FSP39_010802 [Pinctada imbricata]|uniref:Fibronectin type III-like domain-containing protein n=1 Tax=Pinctada imbricata TaxID=66713 RepID=A0AA89C736_PINIB|nr:hypothetical protein FSP39_010802 [Pinctada imbricata]